MTSRFRALLVMCTMIASTPLLAQNEFGCDDICEDAIRCCVGGGGAYICCQTEPETCCWAGPGTCGYVAC